MAMVKRANGKIENFTDNDGDEVKAEEVKEVVNAEWSGDNRSCGSRSNAHDE